MPNKIAKPQQKVGKSQKERQAHRKEKRSSPLQTTFWNMIITYIHRKRTHGFSMIELLIAAAIVGVMVTFGLFGVKVSQAKARDAERKSDLERIKSAFEDYYNDNNCYPPANTLSSCNDTSFSPYLAKIPCDPLTNEPYLYQPLSDSCKGYRVYSGLENGDDPVISQLNCDTESGCGPGAEYVYGIAAGAPVSGGSVNTGGTPTPTPTATPGGASPSPTGPIYVYACDAAGTCNRYEDGHPYLVNCPVTFPQSNCNNECSNPALRCGG